MCVFVLWLYEIVFSEEKGAEIISNNFLRNPQLVCLMGMKPNFES